MTIVARTDSLTDAYRGIELLRAQAIPPELKHDGDHLVISVHDDFAQNAQEMLKREGINGGEQGEKKPWVDFDSQNT
jgi:hypothetical protein